MYRYSPRMMNANGQGSKLRNRMKNILILVLLAAVIFLIIFSSGAVRYRDNARALFVQQVQVECGEALNLCSTLSRTGGSGSAETLGVIRSRVYAIDRINTISIALGGPSARLVDESYLTQIYSLITSFSADLRASGMNSSTYQNELTNTLNSLAFILDQIDQQGS